MGSRKQVDGAAVTPLTRAEIREREQRAQELEDAKQRLELARKRNSDDAPGWAKFGKLGGAHRADND